MTEPGPIDMIPPPVWMHWLMTDCHQRGPAPVWVLAHGDALLAALFEDRRHFALRLKRSRLEVHGHVEWPAVPFRGGG
jgi:hypothetical protein